MDLRATLFPGSILDHWHIVTGGFWRLEDTEVDIQCLPSSNSILPKLALSILWTFTVHIIFQRSRFHHPGTFCTMWQGFLDSLMVELIIKIIIILRLSNAWYLRSPKVTLESFFSPRDTFLKEICKKYNQSLMFYPSYLPQTILKFSSDFPLISF